MITSFSAEVTPNNDDITEPDAEERVGDVTAVDGSGNEHDDNIDLD